MRRRAIPKSAWRQGRTDLANRRPIPQVSGTCFGGDARLRDGRVQQWLHRSRWLPAQPLLAAVPQEADAGAQTRPAFGRRELRRVRQAQVSGWEARRLTRALSRGRQGPTCGYSRSISRDPALRSAAGARCSADFHGLCLRTGKKVVSLGAEYTFENSSSFASLDAAGRDPSWIFSAHCGGLSSKNCHSITRCGTS